MNTDCELWVYLTSKKIGKLNSVFKWSSFHSLNGKLTSCTWTMSHWKNKTQLTHQMKWFINPRLQMQEREHRPRKHRNGGGPFEKTWRVIEWTICLSHSKRANQVEPVGNSGVIPVAVLTFTIKLRPSPSPPSSERTLIGPAVSIQNEMGVFQDESVRF